MVERLWSELRGAEVGSSYLYFTKALVLAALPGIVEDMDGELVLRDDPAVLDTKRHRKAMARDDGEGSTGGEGETHRQLKEFIYREPDVALASLKSGSYQRVAMEYVFPIGDRVDVVLIDGSGNVLLVEVKPLLSAGDLAPFAQAAKYRVLWSILRERRTSEIRCLVAAPDINASPWKKMKDRHAVECVAIQLAVANR
jgi:RecB family endonuclease NucS